MCIIYARDSKSRIRNYKNFLIFFISYYYLTDAINKTNLTFEKFFRKLEILLQNKDSTERKIAKSTWKNTEDIFEIIRLSKRLKTLFKNTVSIIIGVAYRTEVFKNTYNIKITHQIIY